MSTIITISRQLGSNGSIIATEVAKRLSLRYLDREILHRAAAIVGFPDQTMIAKLESREHRLGVLQQISDSLSSISGPPVVPSATMREYAGFGIDYVDVNKNAEVDRNNAKNIQHELSLRAQVAKGYRTLVEQVMKEQAQKGNVIIAGRGGQVLLRDMPGVLHILIIAPVGIRILRLTERMKIEEKEAKQRVRNSDREREGARGSEREREAYLKHYEKVSWQDPPSLYDLTINTGKIPIDFAVKIICDAAPNIKV